MGTRVWVPKPVYRAPKWPGYITEWFWLHYYSSNLFVKQNTLFFGPWYKISSWFYSFSIPPKTLRTVEYSIVIRRKPNWKALILSFSTLNDFNCISYEWILFFVCVCVCVSILSSFAEPSRSPGNDNHTNTEALISFSNFSLKSLTHNAYFDL